MKNLLLRRGWTEVAVHETGTCWKAPITLTGKPHYFSLEAAYELEENGEGIESYSAKQALAEAARAEDVAFMAWREEEKFARTGIHSGVPPNF